MLAAILAAIDDHAAALREVAEAIRADTAARAASSEIDIMDE